MRGQLFLGVSISVFTIGLFGLVPTSAVAASPAKAGASVVNTYGKLPLHFEANQGQSNERVKFISHGRGYTIFLTATEVVMALGKGRAAYWQRKGVSTQPPVGEGSDGREDGGIVLRIRLVGANTKPRVTGLDQLPGKVNYFVGNDPAKWRTNVPMYARVKNEDVYPGIDLVYYGNGRHLEYDFAVHPGADPAMILLEFKGADSISISEQGNLTLEMSAGTVMLRAPTVYQDVGGARREISGGYVLRGKGEVGFQLAEYDRASPLLIDPVLVYSTYLGGGSTDEGRGIAIDGAGNAYVTGFANWGFRLLNPFQGYAGGPDAFVTKYDPSGTLIYSSYLGGSSYDEGHDIAVDAAGNAYVTGYTSSSDFPTVAPIQGTKQGAKDAFVAKLNPTGSSLVYSTYLGGTAYDEGWGIALDSSNNAYVTGFTGGAGSSNNFPLVNPISTYQGGFDPFLTKINSAGTALVYSTFLGGGSWNEYAWGIAVDGAGSAYVVGMSGESGNTTTFVKKVNAAGTALAYHFSLGGSGWDEGFGIAVDGAGNAYVTGKTVSTDFPTVNPIQAAIAGNWDAFVAKINASGTALVYSTYLGGGSSYAGDHGYDIAVDAAGNAYVTGTAGATDFPMVEPLQPYGGGDRDGFVTKINPAGSALLFSTFLGGSGRESDFWTGFGHTPKFSGIAVDDLGNAYVTGSTESTDFPLVNPDQTDQPSRDAFVAKIQTVCQADSDCDDNNACTLEVCDPNDPSADNFGCVYNSVNCDDGNVCTDDSCNPATGCEYANNTAPCDDGKPCTVDVCAGGVCVGTLDPTSCLDHFLCYKTKARQDIPDLTLSDQFETNALHQVKAGKLLCVPADKSGEGILDPGTHLMGYKIKGPHVPRTNVHVSNQLDGSASFFYDTKKADILLVPSAKSLAPDPFPGPPDPGSLVDHYRCFKVRTTPGTAKFPKIHKKVGITITDQFGSRTVYLTKPYKLCLPVDKNGEGIKNPEAHLLCYKLKSDPRTSQAGVEVTNQFGQVAVELKKEAELCIPSIKDLPTTTTTSTTTTTTMP